MSLQEKCPNFSEDDHIDSIKLETVEESSVHRHDFALLLTQQENIALIICTRSGNAKAEAHFSLHGSKPFLPTHAVYFGVMCYVFLLDHLSSLSPTVRNQPRIETQPMVPIFSCRVHSPRPLVTFSHSLSSVASLCRLVLPSLAPSQATASVPANAHPSTHATLSTHSCLPSTLCSLYS